MTSLRASLIAGLAVLGVSLSGCGPSAEETAQRERAIAAEAKAAEAQAKAQQLAMAPAPQPSQQADDNGDDANHDDPADAPMDDGIGTTDEDGNQVFDKTDDDAGPPPIPMAQPPAVIDVPQPDPEPQQRADDNVEYVPVRS